MAKKLTASADARTYFTTCIDRLGGPSTAARHFAIPFPTIRAIYYGQKGVGHKTAERMVKVDPMLDFGKMMSVRAVA